MNELDDEVDRPGLYAPNKRCSSAVHFCNALLNTFRYEVKLCFWYPSSLTIVYLLNFLIIYTIVYTVHIINYIINRDSRCCIFLQKLQ